MQTARGFTLIELLVVIAIIGLLSSVVLASLNSAREKARDARRWSDVHQLQTALQMYYNDNGGKFPSPPSGAYVSSIASYLAPAYMPQVPEDPSRSVPFTYRYFGAGAPAWQTYTLLIDMESDGGGNFCKVNGDGGGYPGWQVYPDC